MSASFRFAIRVGLALALCMGLSCSLLATSSRAAFGVAGFDGETSANEAGLAYTQAGGHPFAASTFIAFNQTTDADAKPIPDESVRQIQVSLPPGFVGNPFATPTRCTEAELTAGGELTVTGICPRSAQVGVATLYLFRGEDFFVPVYNMVPQGNEPAQLGLRFLTTDFHIDTRVSATSDGYKVIAELNDVSNAVPLLATKLSLWGVPADSVHNGFRGSCLNFIDGSAAGNCPAEAPLTPFITLPTACTPHEVGLETRLHAESWLGSKDDASFFSHLPPGVPDPGPQQGPTGCDGVPFKPGISVQPTTHAADSPTGLHVDLSLPQAGLEVAGGVASSHLKDAKVILPKGMSINPSSGLGLTGCTSGQIGIGSDREPECPDSSKVGSLQIDTPLLEDPVEGSVYLAAQGDNPFGSLLAIYIVAKGPGVLVKLAGHVEVRSDGQLVTTFDDNPQVPFSAMHLDFFGGSQAALRTPATCGTFTTEVELTPWSGAASVPLSSSYEISSGPSGGPCPGSDFAPKLNAGTSNPVAGAYSPFVLRLTREDGEQELSGLSLGLPRGLTGRLSGISYCTDAALAGISRAEGTGTAQIARPACPSASLVGTVAAGAGAGPRPLQVETGRAYLAGPYRGAPLSLAIVAPAVAGPFDLGNVVVRSALRVDPVTAEITAVSDAIPTILHGVPLDLREVRVFFGRRDFILNPTSCDPMRFSGTASSPSGLTSPLRERFQVGSCTNLGFAPRLSLRLLGHTRRGGHPRLRAVLSTRSGDANISRAVVALPHAEFLDNAHIGTVCTRVQFAADACPTGSVYGRAKAFTPLLDQPLRGPVYLRSSSHKLPDLVADLKGQIEIVVAGRIDSVNGGIRNTFEAVPDAPVSRFVLEMSGGRKGLLENSQNLCRAPIRATVELNGYNGKLHDFHPALKADCPGSRTRRGGGKKR
jgi:hypothetical protein